MLKSARSDSAPIIHVFELVLHITVAVTPMLPTVNTLTHQSCIPMKLQEHISYALCEFLLARSDMLLKSRYHVRERLRILMASLHHFADTN
jgi:hypothetical protein